jgi:hypothetical protein
MQRKLCFYVPLLMALSLVGCEQPTAIAAPDPALAASMEAFKHRTRYRELTPAVLASIPDDKLEQAVMDFVDDKIGDDDEHAREIVGKLSPGVRALYVTWWVEAEVNNGGFNQYYWNKTGQFAADAVGAFEFFAAAKHAALMREANGVEALEAERMKEFKKRGSLQAFSESYKVSKLGPLDERFYAISENLSALRIAKIRAAPELFTGK